MVFEDALRGRRKRGSLLHNLVDEEAHTTNNSRTDDTLQGVLGAIKAAPG
jgi:hypothetical protein